MNSIKFYGVSKYTEKGKCTLEVNWCIPAANASKSAGKSPETSVVRMLGAQH